MDERTMQQLQELRDFQAEAKAQLKAHADRLDDQCERIDEQSGRLRTVEKSIFVIEGAAAAGERHNATIRWLLGIFLTALVFLMALLTYSMNVALKVGQ